MWGKGKHLTWLVVQVLQSYPSNVPTAPALQASAATKAGCSLDHCQRGVIGGIIRGCPFESIVPVQIRRTVGKPQASMRALRGFAVREP